jgi:P-type conjugative transfer protein TrbJ
MSRRAISRLGVATLVAAAGLAAGRAGAQVAVFDAGNYAQNLLQAARALTQIANQAAALQNQARMLLNQARNLQPLGASETTAVSADMARVNALARQAGRVADDVAAIRDEFASHYSGQGSDGALAAAADARWRNSLDAFRHVLEVQAAVAGTAAATGAQVGAIAGRGDAAAGALQATQAGDELLAVQAKQLADVTALLAARSRAEALEAAGRAAAAAEGRARLQAFLARGAGS